MDVGVEVVHTETARSLLREWDQPSAPTKDGGPNRQQIDEQLQLLNCYFSWELIIYAAFPLGIPLGLLVGARYGQSSIEVVSICLRFVFGLASLFLVYFLWKSCRRMAHPNLKLPGVPTLEDGSNPARDWGSVMTQYRKMFLVDSIQNTALLIAFVLLTWLLFGTNTLQSTDLKFIAAVVAASVLLNQLPYLLGQWRVQEALVRSHQGWTKITRTKEAAENIPLVPKFEWIAALIGEASAGGLAIELSKKISESAGGH